MAHVVVVAAAAAAAAGFELVVAAAVVAVAAECGAGGVHVVTARAAAGAGDRGAPEAVARLAPARLGLGAGAGRDRRPGDPAPASGHPRSASSGDRRRPVTTHTPPPPPSRPPSHAVTNRHTAAAPIKESHSTAPRPPQLSVQCDGPADCSQAPSHRQPISARRGRRGRSRSDVTGRGGAKWSGVERTVWGAAGAGARVRLSRCVDIFPTSDGCDEREEDGAGPPAAILLRTGPPTRENAD